MGKKGVLMDNGKTAQSSMTLYWKSNKERAKLPKEKKQKQLTMEQDLDIRAVNGFQKWKLHKQKIITKAYLKKEEKIAEPEKEKQQSEQEPFQLQLQQKKREIIIPGYGSKQKFKNRLQIQKIQAADQSKNILIVPPSYGNITQQDILNILRNKKAKVEQAAKRQKKEEEDIILGQQLYHQVKVPQPKLQNQQQDIKKVDKIVEPIKEQPFFKSQIFNEVAKGQKLITILNKNQQPVVDVTTANQAIQTQVNTIHSGFIPRALRK